MRFRRCILPLLVPAVLLAGCAAGPAGNLCADATPTAAVPVLPDEGADALPEMVPDEPAVPEESTAESLSEEPPVLLPIPEGMDTNITDAGARAILAEIAAAAAEQEGVAIWYTDAAGTSYYGIGGDDAYPSASTVKAIYCQYILASGADLTAEIEFTAATRTSSSGALTAAHTGELFAVAELMEYTIRHSDNMAYRLLFEEFGAAGFNEYIRSLGLDGPLLPSSYEFTDVTAKQLTLCMKAIYDYAETTGDPTLVEYLKSTTYNWQIPAGVSHDTAHKYGYEGGTRGYHDTAIIYAHAPYMLTVMTHIDPNAGEDISIFAAVAERTDRLNAALHAE